MRDGFVKAAVATPHIRVADTVYNAQSTIEWIEKAKQQGVKLLVFPELGLTGYTCGDLFLQPVLLTGALEGLRRIIQKSKGIQMLLFVGLPFAVGTRLYNAAAAVYDGKLLGIIPKCHLPNYGEFYEKRHFTEWDAASPNCIVNFDGEEVCFGVRQIFICKELPELAVSCEICEDLWVAEPPSISHALAGAQVIVNLSCSDEIIGKAEYRRSLVLGQSARLICAYLYADGGDGESTTDMVYAGHNLIAENGVMIAESRLFDNGMQMSEIDVKSLAYERMRMNSFCASEDKTYARQEFSMPLEKTALTRFVPKNPFVPQDEKLRTERCEAILAMQSAGLQKRILHSRAKSVVVGISGGLDSCLALLVMTHAMDRLSRDRKDIIAVTMPCFGTTSRTKGNAERLCECLGVTLRTVDIKAAVYQHFADIGQDYEDQDVVFENSQARERTQILMDIANQCGGIVVGTGDLSELALGWATYNGDHMSMYGVNVSVPKTLVRYIVKYYADTFSDEQLSKTLYDILATPVSPELLPARDGQISQITEDLVGPYELHDFFLYYLVRRGYPPQKIKRLCRYAYGAEYDGQTINHWLSVFLRRFFAQQFKRSCLPDGPKVGSVTLSPRGDWRMPSDALHTLWIQDMAADEWE